MTVAVVVCGVLATVAVVMLWVRERDHDEHIRKLIDQAQEERSELYARLQHPKVFVAPRAAQIQQQGPPSMEEDEFERVGRIIYGDAPEDS